MQQLPAPAQYQAPAYAPAQPQAAAAPAFEPLSLNLSEDSKLALLEQWRAIRRYRWQILALCLMGMLLAGAVAFALTPVYRSTATLFIEPSRTKVASLDDVYGNNAQGKELYQSQVEIIKSREVAVRTAAALKLWNLPDFDPRVDNGGLMSTIKSAVGLKPEPVQWTDEKLADAAGERLMKVVTVEPVRLSQLVRISVESPNKFLAQRLANALAQNYIDADRDARYRITQQASMWFTSRMNDLLEKLTTSEKALQQFREKRGLIDLSGSTQTLVTQQVTETNARLAEARSRRLQLESAYQQVARITNGDYSRVPVVVTNQAVINAMSRETEAQQRLETLAASMGTAHESYKAAQANLDSARANTRVTREAVAKSVLTDYEAARNTERQLEASLAQVRGNAQDTNRQEFELSVLEREVNSNRQLYDLFMSRAKETDLAANLQSVVARVVDPAAAADIPVRPAKLQIIVVAGVLCALLGAMVAMLLAKMDNTVKSGDEVEERLHMPVLTTLPALKEAGPAASRVFLEEPHSQHAEAIRTARTGVLLSNIDRESRVIMVTSSVPGEGKTTLACNLGLAHAQTRRTILVDADMRKPQVGARLGIPANAKGLSNLIAGTASLSECLHPVPGSSLMVIPAGDIPPSTLELLHSQRFEEVMALLRQAGDIVLIDTPPVEVVSDALVIAPRADGTIYVVKAMQTAYPIVRKGLNHLQRAGGKVLGMVVNGMDFEQAARYYGYRYTADEGYYGSGARRLADSSESAKA